MAAMALGVRSKLGVLLLTSGWFREVGLQKTGSDTSSEVERTAGGVIRELGRFSDPVCDGVLFSIEEARESARRMLAEDVDGILLVPLMWCEDAIPRAALDILRGLPMVLWTFSPESSLPAFVPFQRMLRGSGPVGALQLSGMLKREDVQYRSVAGPADDPAVFEEIRTLACAMAVRRRLRAARIGVLPFSCDLMSATWVDEFALRARYGVQLRPLELERVRRVAAEFLDSAVAGFRDALAREGARVEVDERNLSEGIRYALALERVAREEGLSALAMNDVITEMHASFGLRPALSSPGLSDAGIVVSMEADVGAAAAMLALRLYTGEPPFYTEPFSADYAANAVLMGHAGMHDGRLAEPGFPVRIVNDVEYENSDRFTGAATLFKRRSGPVTMVNSVWDGARLCWTLIEGESVAGPPKMDGNCHMLFAPDLPVKEFFRAAMESGVSQHWIAVDGRRAAELSRLCEILDFGCMTVPRPG